jgi:hypothetical protein
MPAYTYGEQWLLRDAESGRTFDDIGDESSRTRGRVEDSRPIALVGIENGMTLLVVKPSKPSKTGKGSREKEI